MTAAPAHADFPPCPAPFNLSAYVLAAGEQKLDKVALEIVGPDTATAYSYRKLRDTVLRTAGGLRDIGLQPGDRLLLRLGNSVQFPITFLAAIAAGIIPVPTSTQLTEGEITAIAAILRPAAIIAEAGVALPRRSSAQVLMDDETETLASADPIGWQLGDPERPAYIIFTSGTAGVPRAVVHAHRAVWARRMMWRDWYDLRTDDLMMHAGAFNWTYTLGTGLLDPWTKGATALIPAAGTTPAEIPALLAQEKASIFAAAPGVFRQMLKSPFPNLPHLRHALSAGEMMPEITRKTWNDTTGTMVYEAFGMSECSTFISGSPSRPAPQGSIGFAQPGRKVAILSGTGIAKPGEPGVIAIASDDPGLMLGYLNDAPATDARYRGDWFLTGDTGQMDETGAITYLGRDDDMMNAGGFRVSPLEVENAMRAHPDILDCAAVEIPIKTGVTVIAAFYQADTKLSDAKLQDHSAKQLARYKQPRIFRHVETLPRGANGKLLRRQLRNRIVSA